jgi:hypothetical protein
MATRNHSRGTRQSGRQGGNRPRTHPGRSVKRPAALKLLSPPLVPRPDLHSTLGGFAEAIAIVSVARQALDAQEIAGDVESALRSALLMLNLAYGQLDLAASRQDGAL